MNKTKIEWVKNPDGTQGYTWNPITGCLNGCPYCYARKLAKGRLKKRYIANDCIARDHILLGSHYDRALQDPFYPRFWEERLNEPYTYSDSSYKRIPCKGIFVCDMGELFGDWIPEEWQNRIFSVIKSCPQHRFYLLTNQPQNLIKFSPFLENCWVGVTATNPEQLWLALENFKEIKAQVRFISFEPLLDDPFRDDWFTSKFTMRSLINWVIIGAQTPYSPKTAPGIEWVREIVKAADKVGAPIFLKDNLKFVLGKLNPQENSLFFRADGNLRQEFPK